MIVYVEKPFMIAVQFEWLTKPSFMHTPYDHTTFRNRKEADEFINYHKYRSVSPKIKITHYIETECETQYVFR
jgi:hypothetical protein